MGNILTSIKSVLDNDTTGNNNASNNAENQDNQNDKSSTSLIPTHGYLYRPNVVNKDENINPTSTSMSLANGRRLLITGNTTINLTGQHEFVEDIPTCLSNTSHMYIRTTKELSHGFMGFTNGWSYEVLNEKKLRICVTGLTAYPKLRGFRGLYFFIVNPLSIDSFAISYELRDPGQAYLFSISGPGMPFCDVRNVNGGIGIYVNEEERFVRSDNLMQLFFPYWTYPFYKENSGYTFEYSSSVDINQTVARISRDVTMENDEFLTMKLEFDPSLLAEDRIMIFATTLQYAFSRHFDPVGVSVSASVSFIVNTFFIVLIGCALSGFL